MTSQYPAAAYFSMEVGLDPAMPTYSGGLGVLAGDTLRAAAHMGIPMVGVTLLHRKGYFCQRLDAQGNQSESPAHWSPERFLEPLTARARVTIEGRTVHIRPWRYMVQGVGGHSLPAYFLDTALPENSPWDQTLTDYLYGGDAHYRLCQEVVNGVPSLSIRDGWWIEGHVEGVTGWSIDDDWQATSNPSSEAACLYDKLEQVIVPLFYQRPADYARVMRSAIALNGSFFNAERMMTQYLENAYLAPL